MPAVNPNMVFGGPELLGFAALTPTYALNQLDLATSLDDLRFPPSNRLEALKGNRAGQWSLRINIQWRLSFRFEDGDAFDVEITDYH